MPNKPTTKIEIYSQISEILKQARQKVIQTINTTMVKTYFEIGRIIVENEQRGEKRAEYGAETLKQLSKELTKEFGKGFSERNLEQMRNFYQVYSISQTLSAKSKKISTEKKMFELSWSHYVFLTRLNDRERQFYETESVKIICD